MKTIMSILILFLLAMNCNADDSVLTNTELNEKVTTFLESKDGIAFLPNENKPFTGKFEKYYSNGKKSSETKYIDGKKSGLQSVWHENGQKLSETNYIDGEQNGLKTLWLENGHKLEEIIYKNGKKIKEISYDDDGQKNMETNYIDGKENGLSTIFDKNGKVIRRVNYEKRNIMQEIIARCRTQMGEYGAAMVKACVDRDIEAENALQKY